MLNIRRTMSQLVTTFFLSFLLFVPVCLFPITTAAESGVNEESPDHAGKPDPELREWGDLQQKSEVGQLSPEEEERQRWLGARIMNRIVEAGYARYTLEGEVVDQQGNSLNNIALKISKRKSLGPERSLYDDEDLIINGTFSVKASGYTSIYLYFDKEGYYSENMSFLCKDVSDPFSPDYNPDRKVDRRDIRIVMEKEGNITQLSEEDFKLTFRHQDGVSSGRVVDFARKLWPRDYYYQGPRNPILVTNLLDPKLLPERGLYVLPTVNENGHIASIDKARTNWFRPLILPQELRLVLNDPEGGLIVYDQKEGERAYWSMKLAPEEGYKKEVVLDADWLFRRSPMMTTRPDDGIYFYFKVDSRYGKGRIDMPSFTEGEYALEVNIELQLQMDGTRNLDTGRR